MLARAKDWFMFFNNSHYRDTGTITTATFLGGIIGALSSTGESSAAVWCNTLCGSAYGSYVGLALSFGLHILDSVLTKANHELYSDLRVINYPPKNYSAI